MLGPRILDHDGAVALGHELADLQVDGLAVHLRGVELGALVEVDVEGVGIDEALLLLRREEHLLGAAAQLLGVHPHLMRDVILAGHACHTRTSSS